MNIEVKELEGFLFAENKEDFIKKLIPGTNQHYFFSLLRALQNKDTATSKETSDSIAAFAKLGTAQARGIEIRHLLIKLAACQDEKEIKTIFEKLNKLAFNYNFGYEKPRTVTTTNIDSKKEEARSVFDESRLSASHYIENLQIHGNLSKLTKRSLLRVNPESVKKANTDIIYKYLQSAKLSELNGIPDLINYYYTEMKSKMPNFQVPPEFFSDLTLNQMKELKVLIPDLERNREYIGE